MAQIVKLLFHEDFAPYAKGDLAGVTEAEHERLKQIAKNTKRIGAFKVVKDKKSTKK